MIYIDLSQELIRSINGYNMEIFINILRSENIIMKCEKIVDEYEHSGKNNFYTYIKNCYEVIINMDQVHKYVWNICKLLNNNLPNYSLYKEWQKDKINIDEEIYKSWDRIYQIRNCLEHPGKLLSPTLLAKKSENEILKPTILWEEKRYDLLELAKQSIQISYIFARLVIGSSFLYSKYTKVITDENRTSIYFINDND